MQTRYKKKIFQVEDGETPVQVAHIGGRCPIPVNIQGWVGQGRGQSLHVEDVHAHCRGIGLEDT